MEDNIYLQKLGKKIAQLRKSNELTQEEMSSRLEMNRTALARIEVGKTNSSINLLRKIARQLDISIGELVAE